MSNSKRLRIAVQKSGRLSDDSIALLKAIGIKLNIRDRLLIAHSTNQPIDLLRVRDDDIPGLVMDGVGWSPRHHSTENQTSGMLTTPSTPSTAADR